MRLVDQPIQVTLSPNRRGQVRPVTFRYRGETFRINKVVEVWMEQGPQPWWDAQDPTAPLPEMKVWRVATTGGGLFELGQVMKPDGQPSEWKLLVIHD